MLDRRSRRRVIALAAGALMMFVGSRIEVGVSPACLLVPQDQGCEHGIIS
jgi:hypothetical protein